jgi:hypothetical protein
LGAKEPRLLIGAEPADGVDRLAGRTTIERVGARNVAVMQRAAKGRGSVVTVQVPPLTRGTSVRSTHRDDRAGVGCPREYVTAAATRVAIAKAVLLRLGANELPGLNDCGDDHNPTVGLGAVIINKACGVVLRRST